MNSELSTHIHQDTIGNQGVRLYDVKCLKELVRKKSHCIIIMEIYLEYSK